MAIIKTDQHQTELWKAKTAIKALINSNQLTSNYNIDLYLDSEELPELNVGVLGPDILQCLWKLY